MHLREEDCQNITHHHFSRSRMGMPFFGNVELQIKFYVEQIENEEPAQWGKLKEGNKTAKYLNTVKHHFGLHGCIAGLIFAVIINDVIHFLKP